MSSASANSLPLDWGTCAARRVVRSVSGDVEHSVQRRLVRAWACGRVGVGVCVCALEGALEVWWAGMHGAVAV